MRTNFDYLLLKSHIVRSGKSQTEIHAALGIHRNTISQWVRGIVAPSPDDLYRVLRICGWEDEAIRNRLGEFYAPPGLPTGAGD